MLRHPPRDGCGRIGVRRPPRGIDAEERVERAPWWCTGQRAAAGVRDPAVEDVPAGLQLVPERGDARVRSFERANRPELHDRGDIAGGVEERLLQALADPFVLDCQIPE